MPKLSEAQHQARRGEILDAVFRCLAKLGYARMTTRAIAKEANISVGTLYLYFKDKDEMLDALRTHIGTREQASIERELPTDGGVVTLLAVLGFLLRNFDNEDYKQMAGVDLQLWAEALHHDALRDFVRKSFDDRIAQFSGLMEEVKPEGNAGADFEPEAFARLVVALITGLELQCAIQPDFKYQSLSPSIERLFTSLAQTGSAQK